MTKETRWTDATATRVTKYLYDLRDRVEFVERPGSHLETRSYDNQNRTTSVSFSAGTSISSVLVGKREMFYDALGRLHKGVRRGVDAGVATDEPHSLRDEFWYDPAGNLIKALKRGRRSFEKFTYDVLNRPIRQCYCYDVGEYTTSTYAEAGSVADDTVVHQNEWQYDTAGNTVLQIARKRFHDATGTNVLQTVSVQPKARVSYGATYPDPLGRTFAQANYGTNGAVAVVRPPVAPTASDMVLVSISHYDEMGNPNLTVDPRGIATLHEWDPAGRPIRIIENFAPGDLTTGANRTTEWAYDSRARLFEMTAQNSATGDQHTRFAYGTTLNEGGIARNDLVRAMIYPDSDDPAQPLGTGADRRNDRVDFTWTRQAQVRTKKDQLGTEHTYDYDGLGRWTNDRVTTVAAGVNGAVLCITRVFNPTGRLSTITSYDSAAGGSGVIRSQIVRTYNGYRQLLSEATSGGAVTGGSPKIQYEYATGGSDLKNTVRRTALIYQDGRRTEYAYGTVDLIDDVLCRVATITVNTPLDTPATVLLATYTYMGWEHRVVAAYNPPQVTLTHLQLAGDPTSDGGDPYLGFDRFGRVEAMRWRQGSSNIEWTQYGFDRAGNRVRRQNMTAAATAPPQDEAYQYDGLGQLTRLQRGVLDVNRTGVRDVPAWEEAWQFDETGNWHAGGGNGRGPDGTGSSAAVPLGGGYVTRVNGSVTLDQNRRHNGGNEITVITAASGSPWTPPVSDATGSMIQMPDGGPKLTYDAWQRLVGAQPGSSSISYGFSYDGLGRRTGKSLTVQPPSSSSSSSFTSTAYTWSDQWQMLERLRVQNTPGNSIPYVGSRRQFLWGTRNADDLIRRDEGSASSTSNPPPIPTLPERKYALHDAQSVTALCDNAGGIVQRFGYDAYGTVRVLSATYAGVTDSYDWECRFQGSVWDEELGLYLMRYRYLDPKLGRWATKDPSDRDPIGFVCCAGSPLSFSDPTGLMVCNNKGEATWGPPHQEISIPGDTPLITCYRQATEDYWNELRLCYVCCQTTAANNTFALVLDDDCKRNVASIQLARNRACQIANTR